MSNLGSLVVSLEANIVKYTSDMGQAASIAEQRMAQVDKVIGIVKSSMASLGAAALVGLTLDKIESKIKGAIESAAGLQQLAERTGATVEGLSGLASVAKLSSTDTEALATGLQKFSKTMNDAAHGGAANVEAFRAIGISVNDLKNKKPDEMFLMIANRLATYSDGVGKTAFMQAAMGKSGANLLPVMKDLADVGILQAKVTGEQAAMADEYEKNLVRVEAAQNAVYKVIAFQTLPVMGAFTEAMLDSIKGSNGLKKSAEDLASENSIRDWARSAALEAASVVDMFDGVARSIQIVSKFISNTGELIALNATGKFEEASKSGKQFDREIDAILQKQMFSRILFDKMANFDKFPDTAGAGRGKFGGKPAVNLDPTKGAPAGAVDDPMKKLLEGKLKLQESFIAAEKTQLATREQYLSAFYAMEYMDANTYYSIKQERIEKALKLELDAYDKEASAITIYIAQAQKLTDKQDGRNKLAEVSQKRAATELDFSKKLTDSVLEQAKIYRDFDLATEGVAHSAKLANDQAQFAIDLIGKNTLEVAQLTAAKQIQAAVDERIYQGRNKNHPQDQMTKAIADAEAQKAAAVDSVTASYNKQRTAEFGVSEAFRKYAEDVGNEAAHMENAMTSAFKGMEDAAVSLFRNGKVDSDAFFNSVIDNMIRMMVQESIMRPLTLGYKSGGFSGMISAGASLLGFAGGGDPPVGVPSIVGENGPELFVPRASGTIIPHGGSAGGSSGQAQPLTVHQYFTVGDVASVSMVRQAVAGSERRIAAGIGRSMQYGGALA